MFQLVNNFKKWKLDQKMYVLTREARKILWSGKILIAQQLNELHI